MKLFLGQLGEGGSVSKTNTQTGALREMLGVGGRLGVASIGGTSPCTISKRNLQDIREKLP